MGQDCGLISMKDRVSFAKWRALTGTLLLLTRHGLTRAVGSRSVGSDAFRARGRGRAAAGDQTRGGAADARRSSAVWGLQWVFGPAVWCKRKCSTRVIHWDLVRGSGMAGAWGSAVEAALRRRLTGVGRSRRARAKIRSAKRTEGKIGARGGSPEARDGGFVTQGRRRRWSAAAHGGAR